MAIAQIARLPSIQVFASENFLSIVHSHFVVNVCKKSFAKIEISRMTFYGSIL